MSESKSIFFSTDATQAVRSASTGGGDRPLEYVRRREAHGNDLRFRLLAEQVDIEAAFQIELRERAHLLGPQGRTSMA